VQKRRTCTILYAHTGTHIHMHAHNTHAHTHTRIQTHKHTHTHAHAYAHTHTQMCMHVLFRYLAATWEVCMESQRCITKGARATTTSWCVFVCTCVCVFMCACVCVRIVFQGALLIYKGWHDYYIMVCVCVHVRVCMCMCAYRISRCSLSIRGVARPTSLYFTYIGLARTIYIYSVYVFFGREITKFTVIYGIHTLWPHLFIIRVGQNRIYTPYMAVYSIKFLQKLLYVHRIYMALANPIYNIISYGPTRPLKDGALPLMTFHS